LQMHAFFVTCVLFVVETVYALRMSIVVIR
jgi:hypothetical protein